MLPTLLSPIALLSPFRPRIGSGVALALFSSLSLILVSCSGPAASTRGESVTQGAGDSCCAESIAPTPLVSTVRTMVDPTLPTTPLVDHHGRATTFDQVISGDTPVALEFVFTTCTTICPVMTATFAQLHESLGAEGADLRLVSISLDPEYDSPEVLRAYAEKFGADPRWTFFTGDAERLSELYRRYEVLTGTNKMTHLPFVLFRFPGEQEWLRVEGLTGAADLAERFREARSAESEEVSP